MRYKILSSPDEIVPLYPEPSNCKPNLVVLWCLPPDSHKLDSYQRLFEGFNLRLFNVLEGQLPNTVDLSKLYITGSKESIFSPEAQLLKAFLSGVIAHPSPKHLAGDCFGAQAIANWELGKRVEFSFRVEEDLWKVIDVKINGKIEQVEAHFNHAYFIIADTEKNWEILSSRRFSIQDYSAKILSKDCVDIYRAKKNATTVLAMLCHPSTLKNPNEPSLLGTLLNDFYNGAHECEENGNVNDL